jgi:site-specific recombinase XerD
MTPLAPLLQGFFAERLLQRQLSRHTVAAYRDAFRLLLCFAEGRLHKAPSDLLLEDLDTRCIGAFLDHVEQERGNTARTRNARLAAVHSFFRFAATREPAQAELIKQVLSIQQKRCDRRVVTFLTRDEVDALLTTPNQSTWLGRRDYTLLLVAVQTGLRVSELTGLRKDDLVVGAGGAHIRCHGKGRKDRCTPMTRTTAGIVRAWADSVPSQQLIFQTARGTRLSTDAVERLVSKYAGVAARTCPTLLRKHVTPHVLRHTMAMSLLHAGVDPAVIALWLGHESVATTQIYFGADLTMKERALARTAPVGVQKRRFRPTDSLLNFLENL